MLGSDSSHLYPAVDDLCLSVIRGVWCQSAERRSG